MKQQITKEIVDEWEARIDHQYAEDEAFATKHGYKTYFDMFEDVFEFKKKNGFSNRSHPHWTDYAYKALYLIARPISAFGNFISYTLVRWLSAPIRYFDPRVKERKE
jgi:hypothetical protein